MTSSYSTASSGTCSADIVIFGGGVAGLWLLNRLRNEGYQAILFEKDALGGGQTIASQGIIHGGLKYALSGALSGAANAIADMPARWRSCLQGEGDVDLRGCGLLSDHYFMWSDAGIRSKLKTFFGSKSLRGRVESVAADQYPEFYAQATVKGALYRLPDFVVDTPSLLSVLSDNQKAFIYKIKPDSVSFDRNDAGNIDTVTVDHQGESTRIKTQRLVFCAGEGNEQLITKAQLRSVKTQTRPLKMVYLKGQGLPSVYVHCIGDNFSLTPKLTVTSHVDADGATVWYLGGELAESGVERSDDQQITAARALLAELFPWIDLSGTRWQCFTINRAEANIRNNYRPDDAFYIEEDNVITAWPTKLTLSPSLADKLIEHLSANAVKPRSPASTSELDELRTRLTYPAIAAAHWD